MTDTSLVAADGYAQPGPAFSGGRLGLSRVVYLRVLLLAVLMAGVFWPNLVRLWLKTNPFFGEANWQHAIFVPLIGLYYLYLNREGLFQGVETRSPIRLRLWLGWLQLQLALWGAVFFARLYCPPVAYGGRKWLIAAGLGLAGGLSGLFAWLPTRRGSRSGGRQGAAPSRLMERLSDRSSSWFGMYLAIWGMILYAWAIWPGRNDFLKDMGMVTTLFGVVLLTCGWPTMRVAWFPIVFLISAIPWPELFYSRFALPLQKLSATAAVLTLNLTGVDANTVGTTITIRTADRVRQLNVAEACAGLKSLMTFMAMGAAIGFLSNRRMWQKLVIVFAAVPIAILANMVRVAGQGLLDHYVSSKLSESFAHQFVGLIMLIPAFFLLLGVAWVVDSVVVEEVDKRNLRGERRQRKAVAGTLPAARRAAPALPASTPPATSGAAAPAVGPPVTDASDLAAATRRLSAARAAKRPGGVALPPAEPPGAASASAGEENPS